MFDRFDAARLKIERANQHILDLGSIVFALPDAYVSTIEPNVAGGQTVKYAPPDIAVLGVKMALIIGDALHNLRTAIEYAYLGAVERHAPSELDSWTTLPIGNTRKDVEDRLRARKIDVLSPKLFDGVISHIKPYEIGGNGLIKILHDLDISDKHWLLIPLMRVADISDIVVEDERGNTVMGNSYPIRGDGPFFIDFGPNHKVKNKGKLTVDVVFDEIDGISLLKGMPIMSDLKDFSKIAVHIVKILSCI
jgi:hypothetical protein